MKAEPSEEQREFAEKLLDWCSELAFVSDEFESIFSSPHAILRRKYGDAVQLIAERDAKVRADALAESALAETVKFVASSFRRKTVVNEYARLAYDDAAGQLEALLAARGLRPQPEPGDESRDEQGES